MLRVTYCEPFNGRLALSGVVFAWLKPRLLKSPLWGHEITEQQLYDYMAATPDGLERAQLVLNVARPAHEE